MMPPMPQSMAASMRNWMTMLLRSAPMARRMPISRVRSVTVTSMMFMMPMPPTSRLMAAIPPRIREIMPICLFCSCCQEFSWSTWKPPALGLTTPFKKPPMRELASIMSSLLRVFTMNCSGASPPSTRRAV